MFDSVGDEIALLAAQLDAGTHRLLACIREFDVSEEWHHQGAQSCAHWLTWRIGLDTATAREKVRVARALGQLPAVDGAKPPSSTLRTPLTGLASSTARLPARAGTMPGTPSPRLP